MNDLKNAMQACYQFTNISGEWISRKESSIQVLTNKYPGIEGFLSLMKPGDELRRFESPR